MTTAEVLLKLQELDLELSRKHAELKDLLALTDIARKRAALKKVASEETRAIAARKDLEYEIEDLAEATRDAERRVTEVQQEAVGLTDYRMVQDIEIKLSDLAKELDKNAFATEAKSAELEEARRQEEKLAAYRKKLERSLLADAERVRDQAEKLQAAIGNLSDTRARLSATLDEGLRKRYEETSRRLGGLAVERLEGAVPSICRTTLTEASLSDLARGDAVATCPYCHRILIVREGEE